VKKKSFQFKNTRTSRKTVNKGPIRLTAAQRRTRNQKRETKNEARALGVLAVTNPWTAKNGTRSQRRIVERAVACLSKNQAHLVRNWYESGNPYGDGTRSFLPETLTDARYDQNTVTRREMMRRMRYWEQNSGILKSGLDVGEQYIIGTHVPVVTSTASASDWATKAEAVFIEMCGNAGLNGETFFDLLCIGHRRKKVDGNVLFVETSKPGAITIRAGTKYETELNLLKPCFQMVEAHRIGTPFALWQENDLDIFDGVQYRTIETKMPDGRIRRQKVRSHFWVNDSANDFSAEEGFTDVPIENCYYAASAHRVNETRSVSDFYAAEPTLALLEDLLKMEMRAQEVQSDIALFITNGAGAMVNEKTAATMGGLGIKLSKDADGKPVVTAKDVDAVKAVYEKIWGGRTAIGRTGDTLTAMAPNRPAEATLNLWNYLINLFCSAARLPRLLVFPTMNRGQGTEVRAEIEKANAAFIAEFNRIWKPFIHRAWKYFIGWAIKNDERLKNAPADWASIEVSPPRSLTVDIGYDNDADLAKLAAGVTNLHTLAQKYGTTKSKLISQSVSDLFDIKLACAKKAEQSEYAQYGITVDAAEVRNNLGDVVKNLAAMKTADAAKATAEANAENPDQEKELIAA